MARTHDTGDSLQLEHEWDATNMSSRHEEHKSIVDEPDIEQVLFADPDRVNVYSRISVHNLYCEDDSCKFMMHMVLSFYYLREDMVYFMSKDKVPGPEVEFLKEYGSASRFLPFLIFNSIEGM